MSAMSRWPSGMLPTAKERAAWAASYAVAASEMARLAALDAEVARREAEAINRDTMSATTGAHIVVTNLPEVITV